MNEVDKKQVSTLMKKNRHSGLWMLILVAVLLESTACIQYFYTRNVVRRETIRRAESELRRAELEINVVTAQVEMAVKMMAYLAERELQHPDSMFSITRVMVEQTPNMVGAAIGFVPDYYPGKGRLFEAYSHEEENNDKTRILTRQIGSEEHNYLSMEWFENGMSIDSCWWCEPYYDNAGAKQMLVSCSYPIRDASGRVVAVALADVAIAHLQRVSEYLKVYPECFYSITSGKGNNLVEAPDTLPGRKYSVFTEFIESTGWDIAIIIPDDVIYADLRRMGRFVTIMMIIGLLLLLFMVYRSAVNILNLFKISGQNERMGSELRIASKIQESMLPKIFPPFTNCRNMEMYGSIIPAKEVGGDLYDFCVHDKKLFFCVGDVSGKGVPASLVMAVTMSLFRYMTAHEAEPARIVTEMNNTLADMNDSNMFVTLIVCVLDTENGTLRYCNAGHNAPLLCSQGDLRFLDVEANLPLGILSGFSFKSQQVTISRGDTLFLYTDGLTEAENIEKELFGDDRLKAVLASDKFVELSAKAQVEKVRNEVGSFVGKAEQSDDLTMLSVRYLQVDESDDSLKDETLRSSLVMRNDIQQIPTLAEWVDTLSLPDALNMTINLALEEAVSNVMLYAYPEGKSGSVLIDATKTEHDVTFVISDSGKPFDPTQQKEADITLSAEERNIGGLGIHLVRQIMDEISYERKDDKNYLTLVKKLS